MRKITSRRVFQVSFIVIFAISLVVFWPGVNVHAESWMDSLGVNGTDGINSSVALFVLVTVLSLSASIVLMFTHFTYCIIVLGLTRQGLGATNLPPNQVLVGLALFLSLFMMQPLITAWYDDVYKPSQKEEWSASKVWDETQPLLTKYVAENTYKHDINMMLKAEGEDPVTKKEDAPLMALMPAFILTQITQGFLTGMFIYLAFIFIDLIVSTLLMYLGMMMVPPMTISLPFKILVFIFIGGYGLITNMIFQTIHF
ncbi:flagellar biosynthesis protein flip [Listeria monocytogenes serotype 1/2b]|nr:flagellar biosynthesis protein flip [Listeria monocytogenes]EHC6175595.1 flagellar biosynthesis protein flip [Listeria monocytogenes serotype 1/2b]EHC6197876.1 flagellar biosynthesis protein flip [Listeria monocytogenes serotype 1/2b]EHC6232593.1 flagellar biosynthesis protein flip [Listeria monocytogenes serotype 1/2b]EHC6274403.1 flagellar biosynthesis protein flip [Listeria monocytogenes serotype 1/2b]